MGGGGGLVCAAKEWGVCELNIEGGYAWIDTRTHVHGCLHAQHAC